MLICLVMVLNHYLQMHPLAVDFAGYFCKLHIAALWPPVKPGASARGPAGRTVCTRKGMGEQGARLRATGSSDVPTGPWPRL